MDKAREQLSNWKQDNTRWLEFAKQRGWAFLHPDFRGKNNQPQACGSELARQDILDAIKHLLSTTAIDRSRIYLAGTSGGGHMSMLMASYYPDKFSAVSCWVGFSDLTKWHATTKPAAPGSACSLKYERVFTVLTTTGLT